MSVGYDSAMLKSDLSRARRIAKVKGLVPFVHRRFVTMILKPRNSLDITVKSWRDMPKVRPANIPINVTNPSAKDSRVRLVCETLGNIAKRVCLLIYSSTRIRRIASCRTVIA